ncbi:hypothetical protein G1C97_0198 [Bifidobacterium sp. DSM 109959]|uniref:DUF4417 domain-containing protein n=2 Tax=Bifidobacterium olomucense TaxID=2675324 RepID=A0A7Y0HWT3_9BIFI|nr:hypothetical protein [Bifidobacterium sp. DSM 109959]
MRNYTLFDVFSWLCKELLTAGITFTEDGYPIFPENIMLNCSLNSIENMIDWKNRHQAEHPSSTIIVMYMDDELLYRRLFRLKQDLPEYRRFLAVAGFDLSPRIDMQPELQRFNITLSMMATIWLGLHGVRVVANWRIGDRSTLPTLQAYPRNAIFAVGTLGCSHGTERDKNYGEMMLRTKILLTQPRFLLIYGPLLGRYRTLLDEFGILYQQWREYRHRSYATAQIGKAA